MKSDAKQLKESYIRQIRIQYSWTVLTTPLRVKIRLYFKDKRKRDWDNWHKLSMDAMEGIIFENDSQLDCDGVQRYFWDTNPRIEIEIYDYDSMRTYRKIRRVSWLCKSINRG